jgi:hypothetical protein
MQNEHPLDAAGSAEPPALRAIRASTRAPCSAIYHGTVIFRNPAFLMRASRTVGSHVSMSFPRQSDVHVLLVSCGILKPNKLHAYNQTASPVPYSGT